MAITFITVTSLQQSECIIQHVTSYKCENFSSHIEGRKKTANVREQGTKENFPTYQGGGNRRMRRAGHVASMKHTRNQILSGESEGKRLIERPGVRREYIRTYLRKTGLDSTDCIHLIRIGNRGRFFELGNEPLGFIIFGKFLKS